MTCTTLHERSDSTSNMWIEHGILNYLNRICNQHLLNQVEDIFSKHVFDRGGIPVVKSQSSKRI